MNGPVPTVSLVVYAKDREGLARFYAALLGLQEVESGPGFTLLAARGVELAVVGIRADIAARIELSSPPVVREDTPQEFSFLVASLAEAAQTAAAVGGSFPPPDAAWSWRGMRHLDGHDPEGNVVQLRELAPLAREAPRRLAAVGAAGTDATPTAAARGRAMPGPTVGTRLAAWASTR